MENNLTYAEESLAPDDWGKMLVCPICKDINIKLFVPEYIDGEDSGQAWEGRGEAIRILGECESGHHFTIRFGFHKGNTYLKVI